MAIQRKHQGEKWKKSSNISSQLHASSSSHAINLSQYLEAVLPPITSERNGCKIENTMKKNMYIKNLMATKKKKKAKSFEKEKKRLDDNDDEALLSNEDAQDKGTDAETSDMLLLTGSKSRPVSRNELKAKNSTKETQAAAEAKKDPVEVLREKRNRRAALRMLGTVTSVSGVNGTISQPYKPPENAQCIVGISRDISFPGDSASLSEPTDRGNKSKKNADRNSRTIPGQNIKVFKGVSVYVMKPPAESLASQGNVIVTRKR
jgi:hypothetical protein